MYQQFIYGRVEDVDNHGYQKDNFIVNPEINRETFIIHIEHLIWRSHSQLRLVSFRRLEER
uniref:Uncharacterized protein n=1 Tax=Leviviridae sp. TaxID=2027243 RepID=A0A514D8F0_9VIRU|nr:MAG: hypothetical protein H4Bulk463244_000002 [Leviviridae sp.]